MTTEAKVREKIKEMQEHNVSKISWTEEGTPIGYDKDVTSGMKTADKEYLLEEVSINLVKLYMKVGDVFDSVMIFEK